MSMCSTTPFYNQPVKSVNNVKQWDITKEFPYTIIRGDNKFRKPALSPHTPSPQPAPASTKLRTWVKGTRQCEHAS